MFTTRDPRKKVDKGTRVYKYNFFIITIPLISMDRSSASQKRKIVRFGYVAMYETPICEERLFCTSLSGSYLPIVTIEEYERGRRLRRTHKNKVLSLQSCKQDPVATLEPVEQERYLVIKAQPARAR